MTFGIVIFDYFTLASEFVGYFELTLDASGGNAPILKLAPPPGIVLPDPRILCCFAQQIRCIEINHKRLTMLAGKVPTYGSVKSN